MRHETLHDPAIRSEHRTGSSTQGSPFAIEKDKNSLWNGLNVQKGKLYVKKKKSQDTGGFLKLFGENLTGSFCEEGDWEGEKRSPRITHSNHAHLVKKLRR